LDFRDVEGMRNFDKGRVSLFRNRKVTVFDSFTGTLRKSLFFLCIPEGLPMDCEGKQYLHREMSLEKAQEVRALKYKYLYQMNEGTIPL